MLYALILSALAAVAALALERLCAIWSLPRRAPWVLAIAMAVAAPSTVLRRTPPRPSPTPPRAVGGAVIARSALARPTRAAPPARSRRIAAWIAMTSRRIDRPTRVVWLTSSLVVLVLFGRGLVALTRRR